MDETARDDHEYACLFPLMGDAELSELADDIAANGQRDDIWVYADRILDGRNRYRACRLKGVPPRFRVYDGDDPLGFVISKNLHRRHLTESQRAMVAAKLANMKEGRPAKEETSGIPLVSQTEAAKRLGVSVDSVKAAKKVQDAGVPELVQAVEAGEVSVSAAAEVTVLPKPDQKRVAKAGKAAVTSAAKQVRESKKPRAKKSNPGSTTQTPEPETEQPDTSGQAATEPGEQFVKEVERLCRDMDQIAARAKSLKASPYSHTVHIDSAVSQVEAARKTLWQGRPSEPCPYCRAAGEPQPGCKACRGLNRVKKTTYDAGVAAVGDAA